MFDSITATFDKIPLGEKLTVVVFYASYCPFCKDFSKIFEKARNLQFLFSKADITDDDNPLWEKYEIKVVPTVIVFKGRKDIARLDGILGVGLNENSFKKFLKNI
jgi:thiol-disulfide isomerase/thioredoxin